MIEIIDETSINVICNFKFIPIERMNVYINEGVTLMIECNANY